MSDNDLPEADTTTASEADADLLADFMRAFDRSSLGTSGAKRLRRRVSPQRVKIIVHFADPGGDPTVDVVPPQAESATERLERAWAQKNAMLWYQTHVHYHWCDRESTEGAQDREDLDY